MVARPFTGAVRERIARRGFRSPAPKRNPVCVEATGEPLALLLLVLRPEARRQLLLHQRRHLRVAD